MRLRVDGVTPLSRAPDSLLIADDDPVVRQLLAAWLTKAGYLVHQARDAESALDVTERIPVSVALCDQRMPGRGGEWLIQRIFERFPQVAIVLATGESLPERVSMQPGIAGYLSKPFSRDVVLGAVEDAVAWHHVASSVRPKSPAGVGPHGLAAPR